MIEKILNIILIGATHVSFFFIWNLLVRFPEDITAKLIFLSLCPFIVSTLLYMIYIKEKRMLEQNSWKRMGREGRII